MVNKLISNINIIVKSLLLIIAVVVLGNGNVNEIKVNNNNLNMSLDLSAMAARVDEDIKNDIYRSRDSFTGHLTGYAATCPLCTGHLACMPSLDVLNGNVNYDDATYGSVRIVASSRNLACGSIIRFNKNNEEEPTIAIVLDRGVLGTAIDLLVPTEEYASKYIGRQILEFDVLRKGW